MRDEEPGNEGRGTWERGTRNLGTRDEGPGNEGRGKEAEPLYTHSQVEPGNEGGFTRYQVTRYQVLPGNEISEVLPPDLEKEAEPLYTHSQVEPGNEGRGNSIPGSKYLETLAQRDRVLHYTCYSRHSR